MDDRLINAAVDDDPGEANEPALIRCPHCGRNIGYEGATFSTCPKCGMPLNLAPKPSLGCWIEVGEYRGVLDGPHFHESISSVYRVIGQFIVEQHDKQSGESNLLIIHPNRYVQRFTSGHGE